MTEIYKCPVDGCDQFAEYEFYCTQHGGEDLLEMPVSVFIADTDDRQLISEFEKKLAELKVENERLRCCGNCGRYSGYCKLIFSKMCYCRANNLSHWQRNE